MIGSWIQYSLAATVLLWSPHPVAGAISPVLSVTVSPARIYLFGLQSQQQVNVTARYPDGTDRDVTTLASYSSSTAKAAISNDGRITALAPGFSLVTASFGGQSASTRVLVLDHAGRPQVDFERDVVPQLTMMGCNGANCHGSPHGKAGFKLSQFGYEARQDYDMIVRNAKGRRVNLAEPEQSLILKKPTFQVAHAGGKRFALDSQQYQVLLDWLKEGAPAPNVQQAGRIETLEVLPSERVLFESGATQQLVVRAYFSDRTVEDFTNKVKYVSLDDAVLQVDEHGRVRGLQPGEATILIRALGATAAARLGVRVPGVPRTNTALAESNFIDHHVFEKLRRMNVVPSGVVSDAGFVRRVYLDTLGVLPTPAEVLAFLGDTDPHKRGKLIDHLLERPEYAEFWGMSWADLLTINSFKSGATTPLRLDLWVRDEFRRNEPYDQFARTLIAGSGPVKSDPGLGLLGARTPEEAAGFYSQLFLGVRMQCAQCHDHPFEKWRRADFYGTAAFFAQVSQKPSRLGTVIYDDPSKELKSPITKLTVQPMLPGGSGIAHNGRTAREQLADWMTSPSNPFFAKAIVNRIWKHFMQAGLVEPVDDLRDTNPPSNPALLDDLARFFVESGYDLKKLDRLILNSTTYQLSAQPNESNRLDRTLYSRYYYRRVEAEPLLDAITDVTEVSHRFRFGYDGLRAVQLHDPAMYDGFLQAFDRNPRERICSREENHTLLQTLELVNGDAVNQKVRNSPFIRRLADSGLGDREVIEQVYLRAFARKPLPEEVDSLSTLLAPGKSRREALEDLVWSALNSKEFAFNH